MSTLSLIPSMWNIITEIDLDSMKQEAIRGVKLSLVSASPELSSILAGQMRRDPARPEIVSDTPIRIINLDDYQQRPEADAIILLLDGTLSSFGREKELARSLIDAGQRLIVFVHLPHPPQDSLTPVPQLPWQPRFVVHGPVDDLDFLQRDFAPQMIRLLPDHLLSLGRDYPLFRVPIARYLIADTSQSNAAFSLATGLAEIVPILNIPFVLADMIVLTKNQAFLVYKLGLVFGFSTRWQSYAGEFGGVLGFGFLWRQLARTLIGLIPGFGIIPKVGVAYAGTVVVGNAVLQWYLTGRHISRAQLDATYSQATRQSRKLIRRLIPRLPQRKRQLKEAPTLRSGEGADESLEQPASPALEGRTSQDPAQKKRRKLSFSRRKKKQICPQCGKYSAPDASFCQYCGYTLSG